MPFQMPMFRDFVPQSVRPWIYLLIAFTFQLCGGVYLGALNEMIGSRALMREDLLMCMYAMLIGMSLYFPILFRMKFRFTNKTLLTAAAIVMLLCNIVAPIVDCLPLLWFICLLSGMAKIQGTFECLSNIQLWMTPKRDFTIFFPELHLLILGTMQITDLLTTYVAYHYHWHYMHLVAIALMCLLLIFLQTCIKPFRFMKPMPLFGIDWLGWALWVAFGLEVAYLFCYADWMNWSDSPSFRLLALFAAVNLAFCIWRTCTIRHPYLEPKMWRTRGLWSVLLPITLLEAFLATEYVLEEVFYEEVMHYAETVSVQLDWFVLTGVVLGCVFSYWWLHVRHYSYHRLVAVGIVALSGYLFGFYCTLSADLHPLQLAVPLACRGFASAAFCCGFFLWLRELMPFTLFFQSLAVLNLLHAVVGGVFGGAVYARSLGYFVPDNFSRYGSSIERVSFTRSPFDIGSYMGDFTSQMMEISIKQTYGWVLYATLLLLLVFLLRDMPMRRQLKRMPKWSAVRREIMNSYWRVRHGK